MINKKQLPKTIPWITGIVLILLAITAWLQGLNGHLSSLTIYQIFPLLGLLAFSLMWSQYFLGTIKLAAGTKEETFSSYFRATSFIVLAAILLHPGLLIFQLWSDGFGLPPGSVLENYVAPSAKWAATLGPVSLAIFLAFEFHRTFSNKKWWRYMQYAVDGAMLGIFIHALKLGTHLQGWYLVIWWFFGITLIGSIIYRELNKRGLVPGLKNRNNKSTGGAA